MFDYLGMGHPSCSSPSTKELHALEVNCISPYEVNECSLPFAQLNSTQISSPFMTLNPYP